MKLANPATVPVYTVSGSSTARPLPEWLARKRKRSLKNDPEYSSRIELLQDFEFEEASQCVRASEDGEWVMSTGTYKPQIHTHNLPQLSLSFSRHTNTLNTAFELLSSDYSKSIHLQEDRTIEFHTPQGCHYAVRIPRYGRDIKYAKNSTEVLIPSIGLNDSGNGEVFRLHLEYGQFLKSYEIDLSNRENRADRPTSSGLRDPSVTTAAIAETSHNLLAFGTSEGTVEFWDTRARDRIGSLSAFAQIGHSLESQETTALDFHDSGLTLACGSSGGLVHLFDLRSPVPPFLKKDHNTAAPIISIVHLTPSSRSRIQSDEPRILSADKRSIRIWNSRTGSSWTSVEPAVDLNSVVWCKDSGMLLTANEGRQQHIFFVPQLGPAPRWCSFLDNLVEEMAEDPNDPGAFANQSAGDVYENYKFLTMAQLESFNLAHLVGTTSLLRPYMHGYFVAQKLYDEARLISDPFILDAQRDRRMKERIEKERESRIRGSQRLPGQVNRAYAEKLLEKEAKFSQPKANEAIGATSEQTPETGLVSDTTASKTPLLTDSRFSKIFTGGDFEIDETSREYQQLNPSTELPNDAITTNNTANLTAVEQEELQQLPESSSESEENEDRPTEGRGKLRQHRNSNKKTTNSTRESNPRLVMNVKDSSKAKMAKDRSFGSRSARTSERSSRHQGGAGEREVTFIPERDVQVHDNETGAKPRTSRRSASGNAFRRM